MKMKFDECDHEPYDPEEHSYCPDCGAAGWLVELEQLRAENERLRSLLERARPYVWDAYYYGIIAYSAIDKFLAEINKELKK